ncbi:MAG TPA: cytochrome c oxidase subunit II [Candidatus Binatia bacterium]
MWQNLPLFPQQASTMAPRVDALFFFLIALSLFFGLLIAFLIVYFAVKYRRRPGRERGVSVAPNIWLEIFWTAVPFGITMVLFFWGATVFFDQTQPPVGAMDITVVGRQWMWKLQHPEGPREIDELHVPIGRPVKLTMTSEDVIHDFFVPAFRVKMDVIPGRYTTLWFEATKEGEYPIRCSQYCGTQHSGMLGRVVAMTPTDYQQWLGGGASGVSAAQAGQNLFERLGCAACHKSEGTSQGPSLAGLFGKAVKLQGGKTVVADEGYIRESILEPQAKIVAGFQPVMPTFKGLVSEEGILQIIAYIKSLGQQERTAAK